MPRLARKYRCLYYLHCMQLKKGKWSIRLNCQCQRHKGEDTTIYLFDKKLTSNPIYRPYPTNSPPANVKLGINGYYYVK